MSKKDKIRELTIAGTSAKDIANKLHTTPEYVYKERGKLKKEGRLVTHQSLSISDGTQNITVVKDRSNLNQITGSEQSARLGRDRGDVINYDIPPLDKSGLMSMYDSFDNLDGPVEVIKDKGIHPEICEREFARFMAIKSRDPYDLQNELISRITEPSPEIQSIMNMSTASLLSNRDLFALIDFMVQRFAYSFIKDVLNDPSINFPFGVVRWCCRVCHNRQKGVIFDPNTFAGSLVGRFGTQHLCEVCRTLSTEQVQT